MSGGAGVQGMDVAGVRDLARQLQEAAGRLQEVVGRLDGQVARSSWEGRDAVVFRSDWWPSHRQQLLGTAEGLAGLGRSAANNADAQERTSSTAGVGAAVAGGGGWGLQDSWRGAVGGSAQVAAGLVGPFGRLTGELHAQATAAAHRELELRADGRGVRHHHDVGADASAGIGGSITNRVGPLVLQDSVAASADASAFSSSMFQVGRDGVVLGDRTGAEASVGVDVTRSARWGDASVSTTTGAEASVQAFLERDLHIDKSGAGFTLGGALEASADLQHERTFSLSGITITQGVGYGAGVGGHAGVSGNVGPVTSFSANAGLWFMEGFSGAQSVSIDWDRVGDDVAPLASGARAQWDAAWDRIR